MTKTEVAFYHGVIAALAIIYAADQPTLYAEIINTVNKDNLVKSADAEDLEWCGLIAYGYAHKKKAKE